MQNKNFVFRITSAVAFTLLMAIFAFGQVTTGNLQGVVTDQNGAVIPGASVTVQNIETGFSREVIANDEGFYRVTALLPGEKYKITVKAQNFQAKTLENVAVRIGTDNVSNVSLGVASGTVEVTVTNEAPLVETAQSQLSQTYTTKQLTKLPINGGGIETLALLTPGVVTPGDADFTNGVGISANGNRGRSNNFQIDGQDNNDNSVAGPALGITNTEAIGEVQVITNSASAEFGRNAGAQINAVTKSGNNEFHGSVFEYHSNSALNASDNIDKRQKGNFTFLANNGFAEYKGLASRRLSPNRQNRFGGTIGGPIVKNKAFFFATYQGDYFRGERASSGIGGGALTFDKASAQLAATLFPNAATQALTSTALGGGPAFVQGAGTFLVAPPTRDTNGDGIVDAFVYNTPNKLSDGVYVQNGAVVTPLFFGEGVRILPTNSADDQLIAKTDINLTQKDTLQIRYIFDNARNPLATGRALAGAIFDVPARNNNLGATYTRQISSKYTNEARFNFSRLNVSFGDTSTKPGPSIGFTGTRDLNSDSSLTFGTQNNLPQSRKVDVYQLQDTLISTLGDHSLKFGADIRFQKVTNFFLPNFLGVYLFGGSTPTSTSLSTTSGLLPAGTLFRFKNGTSRAGFRATGFENLLNGQPRQVTFALGDPLNKTEQNDYFFFVQDDWRIFRNLTLNIGLRYELSTTPFNPIIDKSNNREAGTAALFSSTFPLDTRTANKLPLDKNNWAPVVGFAWTPSTKFLGSYFENKQTVIRGSFSVKYDPSFFNIVLNTVTASPFAAAGIFQQTPNAVGSQAFPFLPSTTAQLNLTPGTNGGDPRLFNQTRVDPKFYNPYSLGWSFGVQQELAKDTVLEVRYVGNHSVGQFQTVNGNPNVRFLNNAAQCLGLDPGTFSNGLTVGSPATGATPAIATANACNNLGFQNRPGTNGNGRLDPNFGAVRTRTNGASGIYHGLQTRFDMRLSNDFVFDANYTFSKTLDNASEIFSTGGGGQGVADPQRFFDSTNGERGFSAFHQKHNFTSNFSYELPFYKDQKGFVGKFLGGYEVTGIVRLGSGRPYQALNIFATYDPTFENAFFGIGALRNFNGSPSAPAGTIAFGAAAACSVLFGGPACAAASPGQFIVYNTLQPGSTGTVVADANAAKAAARIIYNDFGMSNQFGLPLSSLEAFSFFKTPFGDAPRNGLFGGAFKSVSLNFLKTTNINEKMKLEFRLEAQNLFNSRNFSVPDAVTEDAFGTAAVGTFQNPGFNNGGQRNLRFGVKFLF